MLPSLSSYHSVTVVWKLQDLLNETCKTPLHRGQRTLAQKRKRSKIQYQTVLQSFLERLYEPGWSTLCTWAPKEITHDCLFKLCVKCLESSEHTIFIFRSCPFLIPDPLSHSSQNMLILRCGEGLS